MSKKYLLLILLLLGSLSFVHGQRKYRSLEKCNYDTLAYIFYNFRDNKELYKGKKMKFFLRKADMSVLSRAFYIKSRPYWLWDPKQRSKVNMLWFSGLPLSEWGKYEIARKDYYTVDVYFTESSYHHTYDEFTELYESGGQNWNREYERFFKKYVIQDIQISKYGRKDSTALPNQKQYRIYHSSDTNSMECRSITIDSVVNAVLHNLSYSVLAYENKIDGDLFLNFRISPEGKIIEPKVINDEWGAFTRDILKCVKDLSVPLPVPGDLLYGKADIPFLLPISYCNLKEPGIDGFMAVSAPQNKKYHYTARMERNVENGDHWLLNPIKLNIGPREYYRKYTDEISENQELQLYSHPAIRALILQPALFKGVDSCSTTLQFVVTTKRNVVNLKLSQPVTPLLDSCLLRLGEHIKIDEICYRKFYLVDAPFAIKLDIVPLKSGLILPFPKNNLFFFQIER